MSTTRQALWPSLLPYEQWGDDSRCASRASGVRIHFANGSELLCGTSGLWNVNLGYGNTAIALAGAQALADASYLRLSVFRFENDYARAAASALVDAAGSDRYSRVLFSTSGGAANDLVMKPVRHWHALRRQPQRKLVVGLRGSYHGLTYGSFGLTGEDLGQQIYGVDQRLVRHIAPNDVTELENLLSRQGKLIAAIVVEPVLGSGTIELTEDYLQALFRLREQFGFLLVADEVATGFGRTGPLFASGDWPEQPDVLVASKGLTNGTAAAAAVLVAPAVAGDFERTGVMLTHGETQAGTPVACAAMLATLQEFDRLDALTAGGRLGAQLDVALRRLMADYPDVAATPGRGAFRSIRLAGPDGSAIAQDRVPDLVAAVRQEGVIVHPGVAGVQLIPALTYSDADLAELFGGLRRGLDRFLDLEHTVRGRVSPGRPSARVA